jgi:CDP-diglyceride synthetase
MFKQRLIMTCILIPLVLGAIYCLPSWLFSLIVFFLILMMSFEWQQFLSLKSVKKPWLKTFLLYLGAGLVFRYASFFIYVDILFWFIAIGLIIQYPSSQYYWGNNGFIASNAWILLGLMASILIDWQSSFLGRNEMVCVLFLVWAADIGAYLVGRTWGRHKILPLVSPGKSWEGFIGGLVSVLLVAIIESIFIEPFYLSRWLLLAVITSLFSVVGDLWISILKRHTGLKDTGFLIPGHGGILDRLDSLLAAAPIFYFGLKILGPVS